MINYSDSNENIEIPENLCECAIQLRNNIIGLTTKGGSDKGYVIIREKLMKDESAKWLLPSFVRYSAGSESLRTSLSAIASGNGSWAIRRTHVTDSFKELIEFLETGGGAADAAITEGLTSYNAPAVQTSWTKALDRRLLDPQGAATSASTLLEEVCKHIIEDSGSEWDANWNIPRLYSETAKILNLSPSQHEADIFKSILGNCQSIVQNIGALRNKGGDAHAGGRLRVPIKPRHAALAVNLAGSMSLFLIETWQARREKDGQT